MDSKLATVIIFIIAVVVDQIIKYRHAIRSMLIREPKMEPGEMYHGENSAGKIS